MLKVVSINQNDKSTHIKSYYIYIYSNNIDESSNGNRTGMNINVVAAIANLH